MNVKNLTPELKELNVQPFLGDSSTKYSIYIQPYGEVELERVIVLGREKLSGLEFSEENPILPVLVTPPTEEINEDVEESQDTPAEDKVPETLPDKFICDECGAEFASARSLSAHKNKAHSK